jgi:hypothetical protein
MMHYSEIHGQYYGYAEGHIDDIYNAFIGFFKGYSILITCLDSDTNVSGITKWLQYLEESHIPYSVHGTAIFIGERYIDQLFLDKKTFFGFDSLFLCNHVLEPMLVDKYTTEIVRFDKEVPSSFISGMKKMGAVRFLADGIGLNYSCESSEVANGIINVFRPPKSD